MANQVSILLNHIVSVFEANPLVNTVCFRDDDVLDVEKENIYPLVNINLTSSEKLENSQKVVLDFGIYNQRDFIPKAQPSKLMSETNYIDNIGIVDSIGNDFIMEYLKSHNDFNIFILEKTDFEYIRKDERNCLDGLTFQVVFEVPQNGI